MTPARWKKIEEVFGPASDLPESEREAFVARACGEDDTLRVEVMGLLATATQPSGDLHGAIAAGAGAFVRAAGAAQLGRRIGPYRLVELLGEGGMGVVYVAERDDAQYRSRVAIKILRHGLGSPQAVARFRDERQILAALQHPGIVRLLDGGTTEEGLPYLVMEKVDGSSLGTYVQRRSVRERVELVRRVCAALQYAHGKLVVHRDIKPGNILVTADGAPKLLDFGIAKLIDPTAAGDREAHTRTGMHLLTPAYASPEQARGEAVGVATDVYSLGAVLYEVLVGKPPQQPAGSAIEVLRAICEVDPPRPSTVAPLELRARIAGDLDNIVMKALRKDVAERYASVEQLGDDLARHLDGLPVAARTATFTYRASKLVRRHRGKLAIASAVAIALSVTTAMSVRQARRADREARRAEGRLGELYEEQGRTALLAGRAADALGDLTEAHRRGIDTPALRLMLALARRPVDAQLATFDAQVGKVWWAELSPDGRTLVTAHEDGSARTWDVATTALRATLAGHTANVLRARFSPDGTTIATASDDGTARLWKLDGTPIAVLRHGDYVVEVQFSPDGTRVATASGDDTAAVWHAASGALQHRLAGHTDDVRAVAWTADGTRLVTASLDGSARTWSASDGTSLAVLSGHTDFVMRVAVEGDVIATASWDKTARLWNADGTLRATLAAHTDRVGSIALSRDGAFAVTGGDDGTARVWSTARGEQVAVLPGHGGMVSSVAFADDGQRVLTGAADGIARIWDRRNGSVLAILDGHAVMVWRAAFANGGTRVITASWDGRAKLWDVAHSARTVVPAHAGAIADLATSAGRLATAGDDGVRVWSPDGASVTAVAHAASVVELSRDGAVLASAGEGDVRLWSVPAGSLLATCTGHTGEVFAVRLSPDGAFLATAGHDRTVRVWSVPQCRAVATSTRAEIVERLAFHPTLPLLASAGHEHVATLWDAHTLRVVAELRGHTGAVNDVVFGAGGRWIATASQDRTARLWDAGTGAPGHVLRGHAGRVTSVRFSQDDRYVATASEAGDARLWDVATGRELAVLPGHGGIVWQAVLSPSGVFVATVGDDRRARVWDVATARLIALLEGHGAPVTRAAFLRDDRLITAGNDGVLNLWHLDLEQRRPRGN